MNSSRRKPPMRRVSFWVAVWLIVGLVDRVVEHTAPGLPRWDRLAISLPLLVLAALLMGWFMRRSR
jgi:hypothetical protein